MTYPSTITKEDIKALPLLRFEGEIHLVDSRKQINATVQKLKKEPFLGFDTEKKPTFKKGQYHHTALLQLSTAHEVYLFRLNKIGLPDELLSLMESKDIAKIGIGLRDDLIELKQLSEFLPRNCLDLNELVKDIGIEKVGVRNLAGIFLEKRVSKNQQISNWENDVLTKGQLHYAAADAWVCHQIYELLVRQGFNYT